MNIVLIKPNDFEYYIVYVVESIKGGYLCGARRVAKNGELIEQCEIFGPLIQKDAEKRCRIRAKVKVSKRGYASLSLEDMPDELGRWMEVPSEMREDQDGLIALAKEAKRERYVVFKDVRGIGDSFDLGIEYRAHEAGDGLLAVYDRLGVVQVCFAERMELVIPTERSIEIEKVFDGN